MYKIKQNMYVYVIAEPLDCGKFKKNWVLMSEFVLVLNISFTHYMKIIISVWPV